MSDTNTLSQQGMFSSLASFVKSRLKFSFFCRDDQTSNISLGGSLDHIRHIVFMSRGINNGKSFVLGLETSFSDFHGFSFSSFFFTLIHNVGQVPGFSVVFFSFYLKFFQFIEVNLSW